MILDYKTPSKPRIEWPYALLKAAILGIFLLVVVAILIPTIDPIRRPAKRTMCAMNLKQLGNAAALYANANANKLPTTGAPIAGNWLCDQPAAVMDLLAASLPSGASNIQKISYCPSNDSAAAALWGTAASTNCITGYIWMNRRSAAMPALPASKIPPLIYHEQFFDTPSPSSTELAADLIVSDASIYATANWSGLSAAGRPGKYNTSHMKTSISPGGGNVLYFDGHVKYESLRTYLKMPS